MWFETARNLSLPNPLKLHKHLYDVFALLTCLIYTNTRDKLKSIQSGGNINQALITAVGYRPLSQ